MMPDDPLENCHDAKIYYLLSSVHSLRVVGGPAAGRAAEHGAPSRGRDANPRGYLCRWGIYRTGKKSRDRSQLRPCARRVHPDITGLGIRRSEDRRNDRGRRDNRDQPEHGTSRARGTAVRNTADQESRQVRGGVRQWAFHGSCGRVQQLRPGLAAESRTVRGGNRSSNRNPDNRNRHNRGERNHDRRGGRSRPGGDLRRWLYRGRSNRQPDR